MGVKQLLDLIGEIYSLKEKRGSWRTLASLIRHLFGVTQWLRKNCMNISRIRLG